MRAPITFALCLAFTFCSAGGAAAQRRRAAGARRPAAAATLAPRPVARPAWLISEQPYNEDGVATTYVALQPMPLGAAPGAARLSFGVNLSYQGKSPANFKSVALNVFSNGEQCRFPARAALSLALDGQTLDIPYQPDTAGADGVGFVSSETEGGPCNETLVAYVSPKTLARLAAAKSLSGRIGDHAFEFTEANLGALRDFVSRVAPPQLRAVVPARPRR